ncbi:phototropic-responsive NPH3 family protein [Tanacetum coccineum]
MDSDDIATNLYRYAKRWVFVEPKEYDENTSAEGVCSNSRKAVIEAIERLLPHDQSILTCASLSKMLHNASILEANVICREGFEVRIGRQLDLATMSDLLIATQVAVRIGRQLDLATMSDLLIATQGCSKEEKYDTECVIRILKHFHTSLTMKDQSKLAIVVKLVKDYLWEAANDINLTKEFFLSLAEMLIAESEEETEGKSDGIYRAIDIYLNRHRDLTESEQQLKLREMVTKEKSKSTGDDAINEEEVKIQLEKGRFRVMELEKECLMLRKELENSKKENFLLRQFQLPNEQQGSSKVEEDEDLIVYFGT